MTTCRHIWGIFVIVSQIWGIFAGTPKNLGPEGTAGSCSGAALSPCSTCHSFIVPDCQTQDHQKIKPLFNQTEVSPSVEPFFPAFLSWTICCHFLRKKLSNNQSMFYAFCLLTVGSWPNWAHRSQSRQGPPRTWAPKAAWTSGLTHFLFLLSELIFLLCVCAVCWRPLGDAEDIWPQILISKKTQNKYREDRNTGSIQIDSSSHNTNTNLTNWTL